MSSNPELSTEDLAGTGAHREPQYGEAGDRAPDARAAMTRSGLDENRAAAGQDRTDAAFGGLQPDEGGAGYGRTGVDTGAPVGAADTDRSGTAQQDLSQQDLSQQDLSQQDLSQQGMAQQDTAQQGAARVGGATDTGTGDIALLDAAEEQGFRQRWSDAQARFVDDPQQAVQTADALVAELMQSLARGFSEHKGRLESHWQSGGTPDTEDLRQALQRYRSFFDRLLST